MLHTETKDYAANEYEFDTLNICLIGDLSTGKTCLRKRYTGDKYSTFPTIGVDIDTKLLQHENHAVKVNLWDASGGQRFKDIIHSFFRKAHAAILVFDLADRESFEGSAGVRDWLASFKKHASDRCPIILAGTKADLADKREIKKEEADAFVKDHSICGYFETSAEKNINVSEVFTEAVKQALLYSKHSKQVIQASILDKLNMNPVKSIKELCEVIDRAVELDRFDIVQDTGFELLKDHSITELPKELRESFFQTMANEKSWPNGAYNITKASIKDIAKTKPQLISMISELKDDDLRQNLLWQALISKTFVGAIINIPQSWSVPTLYSSTNKINIAKILLKEKDNLHLMNSETRKALENDDVLKKDLEENSPDLYKELMTFLTSPAKPVHVKGVT